MQNITSTNVFDGTVPGFPNLGEFPQYLDYFRAAKAHAERYKFRFVDVDHLMYELLSDPAFRSLIKSAGGDPDACRGSISSAFREHAHFSKPVPLEGVSDGLAHLVKCLPDIASDPAAEAGSLMAGFHVRVIAVAESSMIAETALMDCGAGSLLMDVDDIGFLDDEITGQTKAADPGSDEKPSEEDLYEAAMRSFDESLLEKDALSDMLPGGKDKKKSGSREESVNKPEASPAKKPSQRKGRDAADVAKDVDACLTDLAEKASRGDIDPVVGRDAEIDRILSTIRRRRKSSIILSGEAGVGKTAIAEGLALRLHGMGQDDPLARRPFYELSLQDMVAGTKFRGDFEARMQTLIKRLKEEHAIVFIDEFHMIVGSGSTYGRGMDGANMLKTALGRGEITVIGATTPSEMREIRQDAALMRRFDTMQVCEPSREETIIILSKAAQSYLDHHNLGMDEGVIEEICRITDLYQPERRFPDKAFDLLDAACVAASQTAGKQPEQSGRVEVAHVYAGADLLGLRRPKLPDSKTMGRISDLESALYEDLRDQKRAISQIAAEARAAALNFENNGPVTSILLASPGSSDPVRMVQSFSDKMEMPFVRIDMGQVRDQSTIHRLIGLSGAVGADRTGQLVEAADTHQRLVLMLENIETTDLSIQEFVTNILQTGLFRAADGRMVSLRGAWIFLSCSRSGDASGQPIGFGRKSVKNDDLGKQLDAGILNAVRRIVRLDEPAESIEMGLARKEFKRFEESLYDLGYTLIADEGVFEALAELGTREAIRNAIFGEIRDLVVREIWSGGEKVIMLGRGADKTFEIHPYDDVDFLPA